MAPFDLITMSLNEPNFYIKLKASSVCDVPGCKETFREMQGRLVSFDEHLNMMLCDAVETIHFDNDFKE